MESFFVWIKIEALDIIALCPDLSTARNCRWIYGSDNRPVLETQRGCRTLTQYTTEEYISSATIKQVGSGKKKCRSADLHQTMTASINFLFFITILSFPLN